MTRDRHAPARTRRCRALWRRLAAAAAPAVLILALSPTPANAHGELVSADPADGATLTADPATIGLNFNQDLLPTFGQLTLVTPGRATHPLTAHVRGRTLTASTGGSHDETL